MERQSGQYVARETLTLAVIALVALLALLVYGCTSAVSPTPIGRIGGALAPADQQEIPQ